MITFDPPIANITGFFNFFFRYYHSLNSINSAADRIVLFTLTRDLCVHNDKDVSPLRRRITDIRIMKYALGGP